jgi:prenyltransferase beta subunit
MIKKIYREEGLSGFYKGLIPSIVLTFNPVIQFTSYEFLKKRFTGINGKISNKNLVFVSLISKLITVLLNYPLLTIKTLYQANSKKKTTEIWKLILILVKKEGFFSLFKGLGSKIAGSTVSSVILMFIYEKIQILVRLFLTRWIFGKKSIISI